jgi:glycosyltransferase involved in cell wall biosynthesis
MPTWNRRAFVPYAIGYFLRQDYPEKELIILDDGTDNISDLVPANENIRYFRLENKITLGAKLNLACKYAKGDIITHWDDDDWYASWRLSYQAEAMKQQGIALCGINNLFYFNLNNKAGFLYIYPPGQKIWLSGSTLCYQRELWKNNPFADINIGMDGLFSWAAGADKIKILEDPSFAVHMIHNDNVSPKKTSGPYWNPYPSEEFRQILKDDWDHYSNGRFKTEVNSKGFQDKMNPVKRKSSSGPLKNVYACLVHEREDCIIDLVRNLHYHDPGSVILLYNGSENPGLLTGNFPYKNYNAVIHPSPVPQKHGYLHKFALDCMEYALENFTFDIFTNVDSDQLCIRDDYSGYMGSYFDGLENVGMLSNNPERVLRDNRNNFTALQAYKEYELWKPLLQDFKDGESCFVHWTFWPSTVFTADAVKGLVELFKKNTLLKEIMQKTKIWATEEVILPTLVRLMGYEIAANPCSYEYVKYRKNFSMQDLNLAMNRNDVFWVHPVERKYENTLRVHARRKSNEYSSHKQPVPDMDRSQEGFFLNTSLINVIKKIEGWMSDLEADLLIELTRKLCREHRGKHNIVEIGSYHGKSTVLFGTVLKNCQPSWIIYSIDTHNGKLGASDQGLKSYPPSFEKFKKNIAAAGLEDTVVAIKNSTPDVAWNEPVLALFIDGLHDYPHVAADFYHFSEWIEPGGYIAFHDYVDYFPGVKAFVDELLVSGQFLKIQRADSLVVLQKTNS